MKYRKFFVFVLLIVIGSTGICLHAQEKLAFLLWTPGGSEPTYVPAGQPGTFKDGDGVNLLHKTDGLKYGTDTFSMEAKIGGKNIVFSYKSSMQTAPWFVIDPANSDDSSVFTDKFLKEICNLASGNQSIEILFKSNGVLINQGVITYNSDGKHLKFKKMLDGFKNIDAARKGFQETHQKELAQQELDEQKKDAAKSDSFRVSIDNQHTGLTYYIIVMDDRTRSEKIYDIQPKKTKVIEMYLSQTYQIKGYLQGQSKDSAKLIAKVDKSWNNKTISVK